MYRLPMSPLAGPNISPCASAEDSYYDSTQSLPKAYHAIITNTSHSQWSRFAQQHYNDNDNSTIKPRSAAISHHYMLPPNLEIPDFGTASTLSSASASPLLYNQQEVDLQLGIGMDLVEQCWPSKSVYNKDTFDDREDPAGYFDRGPSVLSSQSQSPTWSITNPSTASMIPAMRCENIPASSFKSPTMPASRARSLRKLSPVFGRSAGQKRVEPSPALRVRPSILPSEQLNSVQTSLEYDTAIPHPSNDLDYLSQSYGIYAGPLDIPDIHLVNQRSTSFSFDDQHSKYDQMTPLEIAPPESHPSSVYGPDFPRLCSDSSLSPVYTAFPAMTFNSVPSPIGPYRTESRVSQWEPYPEQRSRSTNSVHTQESQENTSSDTNDPKVLCPLQSCRRTVRDLRAHMLTHQEERPEKCPIPSCSYHIKGFARKYDRTRHTLTHYKGDMACDYCPVNSKMCEKTYNRTDVFKRHLQSLHGVTQTALNSRRKKTTTTPKMAPRQGPSRCRTCSDTFVSAQELHDHIDDCVLRVVQRADLGGRAKQHSATSIVRSDKMAVDSQTAGVRPQ